MKIALYLSLTLFALFNFNSKSLSLTNDQINKICKEEKRSLSCKKKLYEKRNNLQKGLLIEIPVIPYKK